MSRIIALSLVVLLGACSTTSTVYRPHSGLANQGYELRLVNRGVDDLDGIAELERVIRQHLTDAGLVRPDATGGTIEVTVAHYYVRSNGARAIVGLMAGRDKIKSLVRVNDPAGTEVATFEVESFNTTAWGTTGGLMRKHAEEIVVRLR